MVTEARNPCDAQLRGRNPFTLSDSCEAFEDVVLKPP